MPVTLANLLENHHINHNIPNDSPFLDIPLAAFEENEQVEVIAILWLYGHGKIDEKKAPKPITVMGDISAKQVDGFFTYVKRAMREIMSGRQPAVIPIQFRWVNTTQITQFIAPNSAYNRLNIFAEFPKELSYFLTWYKNLPMTPDDIRLCYQQLQQLNDKGLLATSIKKIALALMKIEPFASAADPMGDIYKTIQFINSTISGLDEQNKKIFSYFRDILMELSRQYPVTLSALFVSLGITIPENLSKDLTDLLNKDLSKIAGLTPEQWPELVYYTSLFVNQLAQEDPGCNLSYAANELPGLLNRLANKYAAAFKPFIERREYCKKITTDNFNTALKKQVGALLPEVHPKLIALICFKNCPTIKSLFVSIWGDRSKEITTHQITTVLPMPNRFVLGRTYTTDGVESISISNHDLIILDKLICEAKQFKKDKEVMMSAEGAEESNSLLGFFIPHTSFMRDSALAFYNLKKQIKNSALRKSLSLTNMPQFQSLCILNHSALTEFLINNAVQLQNPIPTSQSLKDFFEIISDSRALRSLIEQSDPELILLTLNYTKDIRSLSQAVIDFRIKIQALEQLPAPLPVLSATEIELRTRWTGMQRKVQSTLMRFVQHKLARLEEEEEAQRINVPRAS